MSTCHVQASGAIELLFYGELGASERASVEQHLARCAECRSALGELAVIRSALASRPDVDAPPDGDWSGFMTRLDLAVRRVDGRVDAPRTLHPVSVRGVRRLVPLAAMAALLALVTLTVVSLVTWRSRYPPGTDATTGSVASDDTTVAGAVPTPDAAFVALSEQHLERSKLVVLKLANRDTDGDGDLAYERRLASTLLSDTRLYRLTAEERGLTALARVMSDLELVLLQTSMSEQLDADTVQQIQRLIHKRDLVTKMNAVVMAGGM
jgi:hypothetical protein